MEIDVSRYDKVVHRIYDAGLQPQRWPEVVKLIADLFDAFRAVLFTWAHHPSQGGFSFTHNIPEFAVSLWATKSMREDPLMSVAVARGLMTDNGVVIGTDLLPTQALIQTEFYRELWAPLGIGQVCCGTVFDGTDAYKVPTALSLFRRMDDAVFTEHHAHLLRRLSAHMSRAMGVMYHLRDNQWKLAVSEAALNNLSSGVVLIGADKRVTFANDKAYKLLQQSSLIRLDSSEFSQQLRLPQRLSKFERAFQQAIDRSLRPLIQDVDEHFSQALMLPSDEGKPGCVVHVMPLAPVDGFTSHGSAASAIVFTYDLQSAASVQPEMLCKLFGMTLAEARAALQIAQSGSIETMASRLGVSLGTFKTQLQAAYAKSGTHRQVDLLKMLLALASH